MKFEEFYAKNLEEHPEMMLGDFDAKWKIYLRNSDPTVDPKYWASSRPAVLKAVEEYKDRIILLVREIRFIHAEETGVLLTLKDTVDIAKELRK